MEHRPRPGQSGNQVVRKRHRSLVAPSKMACGAAMRLTVKTPESHIRVPGLVPNSGFLLRHTPEVAGDAWMDQVRPGLSSHILTCTLSCPGCCGGPLGSEPVDGHSWILSTCQRKVLTSNSIFSTASCQRAPHQTAGNGSLGPASQVGNPAEGTGS